MTDTDTLYQKYVDEYSTRNRYINGSAEIGYKDLFDILSADLDGIREEYGSLAEYADDTDECTVLEIYSIADSKVMYEYLKEAIDS